MLPSGGHDDLFDGLVCFLALGGSHEGLLSLPEDLLVNSLDEPIFALFPHFVGGFQELQAVARGHRPAQEYQARLNDEKIFGFLIIERG